MAKVPGQAGWALIVGACHAATGAGDPPADTTDTTDTVDSEPAADTAPADTEAPPPTCPADLQRALDGMAQWPKVASCGHLWFQAAQADQSTAVNLYLETRERVIPQGATFAVDFARPAGVNGSLQVQEGAQITAICEVADETGIDPTPSRTWRAVAGSATFQVTQVVPEGFYADLALTDVVVEEVGGTARCTLPTTGWTDLRLGWYPAGR